MEAIAMKRLFLAGLVAFLSVAGFAATGRADDLACVSTTFNLLSPNDKVCVSVFDDPKVAVFSTAGKCCAQ